MMNGDTLPAGPEEQRHAHQHHHVTAPYEVGIVLPYDLHTDLITVAEAAELAFGYGETKAARRRHEAVIHAWARRGHLPVQDRRGPRDGPRFFGIDVLRAEKNTREKARRAG